MATYVMFVHHTEQGAREVKGSPMGIQIFKKTCQEAGVTIKGYYSLMGMNLYDAMFIVEAKDDESVSQASLKLTSHGMVRIDIHRAFSEDEYKKMISYL